MCLIGLVSLKEGDFEGYKELVIMVEVWFDQKRLIQSS